MYHLQDYLQDYQDFSGFTCKHVNLVIVSYQRWYAGWPGFTATKVPRQVAQTLSCAINSPSTTARSSVDSTTRATSFTGRSLGVGRKSRIEYSAVTVHGGLSTPAFCIKCHAADQLQWQSSNVPIIPPLNIPSNA